MFVVRYMVSLVEIRSHFKTPETFPFMKGEYEFMRVQARYGGFETSSRQKGRYPWNAAGEEID